MVLEWILFVGLTALGVRVLLWVEKIRDETSPSQEGGDRHDPDAVVFDCPDWFSCHIVGL